MPAMASGAPFGGCRLTHVKFRDLKNELHGMHQDTTKKAD
jgi:hypothetical protein